MNRFPQKAKRVCGFGRAHRLRPKWISARARSLACPNSCPHHEMKNEPKSNLRIERGERELADFNLLPGISEPAERFSCVFFEARSLLLAHTPHTAQLMPGIYFISKLITNIEKESPFLSPSHTNTHSRVFSFFPAAAFHQLRYWNIKHTHIHAEPSSLCEFVYVFMRNSGWLNKWRCAPFPVS